MLVFPTLNMVYSTHLSGLLGHFPPHSLPFFLTSPIPSISTGFPVLSRPTWVYDLVISKLGCMVTPAGGRVGCMVTPHWGRECIARLLLTGEVGLMVTSHWGSWFQGFSLLGERMGCMVTPRSRRGWLHGYSPLKERLVAWLLPTKGEGGLQGYFSLGKLVSWLLPTGVVGFRVSPCWGRGWVAWLLPLEERLVAWLLPAQGEVGCMVTPH